MEDEWGTRKLKKGKTRKVGGCFSVQLRSNQALNKGWGRGCANGVWVFKGLLNRDTESCRVGKKSTLITLVYCSALLKFESHAEFTEFANTLKICRNQKKEYSVFSWWTEEVSAAQSFQFYGCISQQRNMMQDFVRTASYHRAIQNHIDFRDKNVTAVMLFEFQILGRNEPYNFSSHPVTAML
ncbi:histone-arginine methyltransferase CARM1-like [Saimiri boliviensis]|uniref:histone-arginine methyltransferase CARM1-like n=1 Tax=Saimiri boliviensis TaxID=27679 RepID=UPI003D782A89